MKRPRSSPASAASPWLPWAILALLLLFSAAFVLWVGRGTVFRGDDWDLLLNRGLFTWEVFLTPHNEHLSALLVVPYKAIPEWFGPHYGIFRLVLVLLDVAVAALFFVFARERVGDWLALLATAPLLLLGGGSDNLLWPTQIGVVGSLACGLGMLILLDRSRLAAKVAACALLAISICFSSDGLFFLAAAGVWLVLSRDRWRDLWIVAIPALAYAGWYSDYGSSQFTIENLRATPQFVLNSAAGGVSALTGIRPDVAHAKTIGAIGAVLGLAALGALAVKIRPRLTPRLVAIVALPPLSWVIIALGRADTGDPFASRYVYASALFILMAILEVVRGDRVRQFFHGWRFAALTLVVGISVLFSAKVLVEKGDQWRVVSEYVNGRLAAIELTRRTVDANLPLEPLQDMGHTTAGWYFNAVERFGESPIGGAEIAELGERGRGAADQVLADAAPAQFAPLPPGSEASGGPPPVEAGSTEPTVKGSCLVAPPNVPVSIDVPARGIMILPRQKGPATVRLRRFASTYKQAPTYPLSEPMVLTIAADYSDVPWHARISGPRGVSVCGTEVGRGLRQGPQRPRNGDQGCTPASIAETECRFRRY